MTPVPFLYSADHGGSTGKFGNGLLVTVGSPFTVAHAESLAKLCLQSTPEKIGSRSQGSSAVRAGLSRQPFAPPVHRKPFTVLTLPPDVYSTTTRMSPSWWSPVQSTF